jgi:hypothetical protein
MARPRCDSGAAGPFASILMVALTVLLAMIVLLMCLSFSMPEFSLELPGRIFIIEKISHIDDRSPYSLNYDSRIILVHRGRADYANDDLMMHIYRNGVKLDCVIEVLDNYQFIGTHHLDVENISGAGTRDGSWLPDEYLSVDLQNGLIHPGDEIRVDIIQKSINTVISRDIATA